MDQSPALTERDQNITLKSLRASIFHAAGAVFVSMQITQAARWARAGTSSMARLFPPRSPAGCQGPAG